MKLLVVILLCMIAGLSAYEANPAPENFQVKFTTILGNIMLNVTRSYAPIGVDRFYQLVKLGYYNQNAFFRVVPGFVVQFGISGNVKLSAKWRDANIQDDPVKLSNTVGTIAFATAGPNTRTTQLFINYADNSFLDSQGFAAFAQVTEGMDVATRIYSGYGQQPNQDLIYSTGNAYLQHDFPNLDYILSATVV